MKRSENVFNEEGLVIVSKGTAYQCLFDTIDFDLVSQHHWFIYGRGYATTHIKVNNKPRSITMHRLILGIVDNPEIYGDHRNHNKLDNRRKNIRKCTLAQNQKNRKPRGKSKYLGVAVYWRYGKIQYLAQIYYDHKHHYIKRCLNEEEAAMAYDAVARIHHGEFANLNFPDNKIPTSKTESKSE